MRQENLWFSDHKKNFCNSFLRFAYAAKDLAIKSRFLRDFGEKAVVLGEMRLEETIDKGDTFSCLLSISSFPPFFHLSIRG